MANETSDKAAKMTLRLRRKCHVCLQTVTVTEQGAHRDIEPHVDPNLVPVGSYCFASGQPYVPAFRRPKLDDGIGPHTGRI